MRELILQRPSKKQAQFLGDRHKHILFGGARGGGKSWAVRDKAKRLCLRYSGIKVLIVRRTIPELQNNHIYPLRQELTGVARYNKSEKLFLFPNGSTIRFGYCATDSDLDQYQGAEYDVIFLDEASQLRELWIKKITACLRGVNDFPKRIYYTCNPGGPSHSYFKRLFIDRVYEEGEDPEDYSFIQSLVTDNTALMKSDPDYVRQLRALPGKLRDAWLHGKWDLMEGRFFEELRLTPDLRLCEEAGITAQEARDQGRFTHVIAPLDMNTPERRGWRICRSYDFGYNKPFSLGYWAVDYDGVIYRILELYGWNGNPDEGIRWTPEEQFQKISRLEREHPWLRGRKIYDSVADPAIWDRSRGEAIADTAARYGIYFTPGDNQRLPGWMQVHYRLQFDEKGYPRMYIFEGCEAFIRTMPLMMYDPARPEDLDTRLEDHCADEVRYFCMSRPVAAVKEEVREIRWRNPLA